MSKISSQLQAAWAAREPREQKLLILLGVILLLWVLIKVVWLGLNEQKKQAQNDIQASQVMLQQLNEIEVRKRRGTSVSSRLSKRSLLSLADLTANRVGIPSAAKKRMQPTGAKKDKLSVILNNIRFSQAIAWMDGLSGDPTLRFNNLELSRQKQDGYANLTVTLHRVK